MLRRGGTITGYRELKYETSQPWGVFNTRFERISSAFHRGLGFSLLDYIRSLKEPAILDWGFGNLQALRDLSKEFPEAQLYGFGNTYPPQENIPENITLIIDVAENIMKHRGLWQDGKLDLIYSYISFDHYCNQLHYQHSHPEANEKFLIYLWQLSKLLKPKGEIWYCMTMMINEMVHTEWFVEKLKELFEVEYEDTGVVYVRLRKKE